MTPQLWIADLAKRTGDFAIEICNQLSGTKPKFEEKIFYGFLGRQATLLPDISRILSNNSERQFTSAFIIFRCLLDDFITLLHFKINGYKSDLLIKHTADGFNEKFKTMDHSMKINYKHHQGIIQGMVNKEYYEKERNTFLDNPENHIFLNNIKSFEFKVFPSTTAIVDRFPPSELSKTFAHSFILWRHLSNYIHYTNFTFALENNAAVQEIDIKQLKEAVYYCYYVIQYSCEALIGMGRNLNVPDVTPLIKEITTPFAD